ncbi:MAG: SocA family protein [Hyphomicrobium sp.]|uniref:Panacea domain-containing protein n=1 Tax=Hyphomicrobium sp. TaxID=82 RepID=UPI001327FE33|nr:Panacea domain-containing protein [Hyphomicrobium sp.]KAB2941842.1 MAG: SocA family protein [Hyphomicrobium sp.]MBZ0210592.1 SocA family protein [Hyphomicrobium sp.]
MEEGIQFDREKFKDVVHYVVEYVCASLGTEVLGNTKLHKVLYYSDVLRYLDTGHPLTGVEYQRQKFGPTARHLTWALKELEAEGRVSVSKRNYYGYQKSEYQSLAKPNLDRLSKNDTALIEHVIAFICTKTAVEISDFSHDEVWASVPMGETIPYYASLSMFPTEITDEDVESAADEAVRLAPMIEAEQRRGRRIH